MGSKDLNKEVLLLKTRVRHLENDFQLTREEHDRATTNYLEILEELKAKNKELEYLKKNLEKIVNKRTRQLKNSEEKFRNLTETANDAIISVDNTGKILSWNDGAKRMFGFNETDVIGKSFTLIIPPELKGFHKKKFDNLKYKRKKWFVDNTIDISGKNPDGEIFYGEVNISFWYRSGKRCYTCIIRDVTIRKRAEKNKLKKEKLLGVLEMAGAACHELNQPLQVISGYSSLLLSEVIDKDTIEKYSNMIHSQVDKLGEITEKLQNVTKYKTKDYLNGKIIDIEEASKE